MFSFCFFYVFGKDTTFFDILLPSQDLKYIISLKKETSNAYTLLNKEFSSELDA